MSEIIDAVRERYANTARSGLSSERGDVLAVAEAFGYTAEELSSIPAEANMGLSCGNPTAIANLREGETVVDLGSGGGLDVFLAAAKVGTTGRAIGIDMTPEMIALARRNAEKRVGGASNVEFHLATIDALPLADASVDCVISNCVINLAPDKPAVFREIARVLKPGGRLAASDIALKQTLPPEFANDLLAYVGCIGGAISIEDYRRELVAAGFSEVLIVDSNADLNAYSQIEGQSGCCSPATTAQDTGARNDANATTDAVESKGLPLIASCCAPSTQPVNEATIQDDLRELFARYNVNDYAASVRIYAVKPARES